ncbi:MAG: ABC transporter substrate-binding protein [Bacteroidales bacterium]|nr:ABC transporter substrate-binding protein [Candidatus Cryptobacteroides caccocaballi]
MKKLFKLFSVAAALLTAVTVSAKDRDAVLKVYNWSSYIDESVLPEFEQWYFEQTGEKIEVIYSLFDVNEAMLSKIEKGHEDYDVVCPSDYMIERMLNNNLLLPLDFDALKATNTENYIEKTRSPYIRDIFRSINPKIDANLYSVAYMWGTTGIIFNTDKVSREDASTWDIIRNPKYAGQILLKDAPRDVFAPVLIYLRQEQLKNGEVTLQELMSDSSDKSIADVEAYLLECKPGVCGFEADLGKEQLTKERALISLNWSGDAVWAIEEAAAVGVNLDYIVPEEGSTVWFDGWVIPKYAKNIKAATYFIDFMCRPDIAIRCMEETGYIAANGAIEVLESQIDESYPAVDLSYFFGEEADSIHVNPVLYPDITVIERCALEHDWGQDTEKLLAMWQNVKGSRAGLMTYIILALVLAAGVAYFLVSSQKKNRRRRPAQRRR